LISLVSTLVGLMLVQLCCCVWYFFYVITCIIFLLYILGIVTPDEIMSKYDFTWHPEVRAGKKTVKEAAKDFMQQWDRKDKDGLITPEEFEDYYKDVSAGIDDDSYFELMMRNAWRIAGGTGAAANTANKRVLVTNRDGSQSVATIENELGMRPGDREEARRRLAQQGIDAAEVGMHGGVDNTSKARKPGGRPSNPTGNYGSRPQPVQQPQAQSQRQGMQRSSSSSGGGVGAGGGVGGRESSYGSGRPAAREAWIDGPGGGDESFAPPVDAYSGSAVGSRGGGGGVGVGGNNAGGNARPGSNSGRPKLGGGGGGFDPYDALQRLLYSPPIPMEPLCAKLQVSSVSTYPRIAMGAFATR
jgi:hypothetical protein